MQLPKLTPLQARFAASFLASAFLVLLYLTLTSPQFAYATDLDSRIPPDHNHPILFDVELDFEDVEDVAMLQDEQDLAAVEGNLVVRAPAGVIALSNNDAQRSNLQVGETQNWVFPQQASNSTPGVVGTGLPSDNDTASARLRTREDLPKRQSAKTLYISLNTCQQPSWNGSKTDKNDNDTIPPQLELWISQSSSIQRPGPALESSSDQQGIPFSGGFAAITLTTDNDVYIGISAPNTTDFNGIWNYEIAGSIDAPFHSANTTSPNLAFIDGDNHAVLLVTGDLTQQPQNGTAYKEWMSMRPPFSMFAQSQNDSAILGLQSSYCGLKTYAQIVANQKNVDNQNVAVMTNRGSSKKPKEQFYVTSLNASTTYWAFLALEGNSTASGNGVVGGGGKVWAPTNFTTKTGDNCALMYNLSFCSEVAYAVPTNPDKFSPLTGLPYLAATYDKYASDFYKYFNYSLQQIPCNTTATAQYSLARTCNDCAVAYKKWLCAVTIPRCEDYSNGSPWLMPRNTAQPFANGSMLFPDRGGTANNQQMLLNSVASNSSRNPIIDEDIEPGPYKEILPCVDLCHDLVRSCPATLGFSCPLKNRGMEDSYGISAAGPIQCSYPGAEYYFSGAYRLDSRVTLLPLLVALGLSLLGMTVLLP